MEEHPGPPFNLDESDVSEEKKQYSNIAPESERRRLG